ncbi:hypothetical protein GALMADRAFT_206014 [Galerina marginata CBS 339.88]|uniref:F-box domain-containing protein n=1 Tax=Galerina marginata (strain CBS 339.88) TaxID=685588 RepID=A0A067TWL3_GALM3|nr:hypothetical protein GALMADRAFT_206014 [Galerina marginata CBS 339.88]
MPGVPQLRQATLPVELLRPIVEDLTNNLSALCALSLSSKTLQLEAERLLYRSMTMPDELKHANFLTSIIKSSRRAISVQSYSQKGVPYTGKRRLLIPLCLAMKQMKNLKTLFLETMQIDSFPGFPGDYPFRLEGLNCGGSYSESNRLSNFLQFQPKLKWLHVEWSEFEAVQVPSSTCPELTFLHGNRGAIEAFLPGRPITSLAWDPHPLDSFDRIDYLSVSLRKIQALCYGGQFIGPDLNLVIHHLPSIKELHLLSQIPKLRILLILCQFTRRKYPSPPFNSFPDVMQGLFSSCQSLEYVEISYNRSNYERWLPGLCYPEITHRSYKAVHPWWDTNDNGLFEDEFKWAEFQLERSDSSNN